MNCPRKLKRSNLGAWNWPAARPGTRRLFAIVKRNRNTRRSSPAENQTLSYAVSSAISCAVRPASERRRARRLPNCTLICVRLVGIVTCFVTCDALVTCFTVAAPAGRPAGGATMSYRVGFPATPLNNALAGGAALFTSEVPDIAEASSSHRPVERAFSTPRILVSPEAAAPPASPSAPPSRVVG